MEQKDIEKLLEGVAEKNGKAIKDAVRTEVEAAVSGVMKSSELADKLKEVGIEKRTLKRFTQYRQTSLNASMRTNSHFSYSQMPSLHE